jgi:uncharacterized protein YegP (UPF0339 family)
MLRRGQGISVRSVPLPLSFAAAAALSRQGTEKRGAGPMTFHVRKDARGLWRWNLTAINGRKIASSTEGYKDKKDCLHAIELVRKAANDKVVEEPN